MHIVVLLVAIVLIAIFLMRQPRRRVGKLPHQAGTWGAPGNDDPRLAAAAMMIALASEDGEVTREVESLIAEQLETRVGLAPELTRECLSAGRRLADRVDGDLTSRLHQLMVPILRHCSEKERHDVVLMLEAVAGPSSRRIGPVREGLGRVRSTLLAN